MLPKIVIHTDADFTPKGKRKWHVVSHLINGKQCSPRIRWYVGRSAYRDLEITDSNVKLSNDWVTS